ncbi:MAG: DUF4230 domain-containing protein, partial [Salinivirgaceae bacterium]|nr:DUF4230 domain-containing protein [Salinivirgaceae bacterium]
FCDIESQNTNYLRGKPRGIIPKEIKLFSKGASFLLQVILIVAAVLIFAWFDPFDFLSPNKTTLKNTPIQLESIKEIGKLISAEYYDEVIASLDEVIEKELTTVTINFKDTIDYIHDHFEDAIQNLQKVDKFDKKQKPYQYFYANYGHLVKTELFELYLKYVYDELSTVNSFVFSDFNEVLTNNQKEKLFRKLYQNNNWKAKYNSLSLNKLNNLFNKDETKKSYKEYKKSKLVLVGRGWIKAGFNFEKFSQRNFKYNNDNNKIYFIGLQPEILSKTINPWFIPEEEVEGFEFIIAEKGGLHNPEYTYKVKKRCLEKLEAQAMSKQILKQAKTNAERNLKAFF